MKPPIPVLLALALALLAAALGACDRDAGPTEEVLLVDYQFERVFADKFYGTELGKDRGLHWFADGWDAPQGGGVWSEGPRSTMVVHTLGRQAVLRFACSTPPPLAQQGQTLVVELNGRELASYPLSPGWGVDTCVVQVPDDLLEQGVNEIALLPSRLLPDKRGGDKSVRRGISLKWVQMSAQLTARQREEWRALNESPPWDPQWASITLPEHDAAPARGQPRRNDAQPDVLLFLMDTTRADHVGAHGYERGTSPVIDALAEEGVHLRNVIVEAPYTLCSVPSLMTGRSWHEHKVQHNGEALAEDFVTLAELLQNKGYETFAISDNPNVSFACNTDQGFDEFYEMWKPRGDSAGHKPGDYLPELPEQKFVSRLGEGIPDGPTFFYVHTMHPHAPYFPGEDHDLFKPANYKGKITGTIDQMQEFDRGSRSAEGPAYERLVTLYDGSVHRGDASIGRMIEAWRALKRDRPVLVVVVSDHGEAFGEHGRFSHNTTPYDEMVQVPVVFHPASLVPGLEKSAGNLRSLSDVTAILLHYLEVRVPGGTAWPKRFLQVLDDPSVEREEIFIRCRQPVYARRTPTSLTVLSLWSRQEYYDLRKDPRAHSNLRPHDPKEYLTSLRRLRAFLEHDIGVIETQAADLSEEDLERLRSLGYM